MMTYNQKFLLHSLKRLWGHINLNRRKQFGLLITLMISASIAEIFSIGAALPFLAVLTDPQRIFELSLLQPIIKFLGVTASSQLLLIIVITFSMAALIAGILRMLLLWASFRLSYSTGADLSIGIYQRTLHQPYATHVARNSSEIINGISGKTGIVITVINSVLALIASSVILLMIMVALLSMDPIIALLTFGGFGFIYLLIIRLTQKRQLGYSRLIARESTLVIKSLQEGLGGIRDILIDGTQNTYCNIYKSADISLRRAQGQSQFISQSPRYGVEALAMVMIAILAYSLSQQAEGINQSIPILGTLALGAQRLLPVLQHCFSSWSIISASQASLEDALDLLDQPLPEFANGSFNKPFSFQREIYLHQLWFRYNTTAPWLFKNLNLTISKGSRIGLIGSTGCGKSTLLDILMGLLHPTSGELIIDGEPITTMNYRSWQAHIAHVPQSIFLTDGTIEENIAFGASKDQIDIEKVKRAAQSAQIADFIDCLDNQYQTEVGERGVRLSGGQRQRIGIARALYKEADVLILDEATSALDGETEQEVMRAIEELDKHLTIFIIAHRISTLKGCSQIIQLGKEGIQCISSYKQIVVRAE